MLRERIALANDKHAKLEADLKDSEARCSALALEKTQLE